MSIVNSFFSAAINGKLGPQDVHLPLAPAPLADLLNILSDPDDYILLTLRGERNIETVRARNQQGTIILERGLEGTQPVLHHFGTCVSSLTPTVIAAIKDLVCNYSCCADDPCPCTPVEYVGATLPEGKVAQPWQGSVIFKGTLPMATAINGIPDWVQVVQNENSIFLTGTPDAAGTYAFSVAATNCGGTKLDTQTLEVTVKN